MGPLKWKGYVVTVGRLTVSYVLSSFLCVYRPGTVLVPSYLRARLPCYVSVSYVFESSCVWELRYVVRVTSSPDSVSRHVPPTWVLRVCHV